MTAHFGQLEKDISAQNVGLLSYRMSNMLNFFGFSEIPEYQTAVEHRLGPASVVFGTHTDAHQSICEILGSRVKPFPVVLPVTCGTQTIAGVLRSGAQPVLLDVDQESLQINPVILKQILEELGSAVVVLTAPLGIPTDPSLLDVCKDYPTVLDSYEDPFSKEPTATFNVFSFFESNGSGSVVFHKYRDQLRDLRLVRSGMLGLDANMPEIVAKQLLSLLTEDPELQKYRAARQETRNIYREVLQERLPFLEQCSQYFVVRVKNASRCVAHLHDSGFAAKHAVYPVHRHEFMKKRWAEEPEYPNADQLYETLVALPVHPGIRGFEKQIVDTLLEVVY